MTRAEALAQVARNEELLKARKMKNDHQST